MKTELNYTQAFQQLQLLVRQLEQGGIELNELTEKVEQANTLIAICEAQLKQIEKEVEKASAPTKVKAKRKKE
ncbi:MAG: exodeoxyribonuclease VII small subunit [bacterium]|nr:exodeoxyribonuclease VII small subunit [bacterium]